MSNWNNEKYILLYLGSSAEQWDQYGAERRKYPRRRYFCVRDLTEVTEEQTTRTGGVRRDEEVNST